MVGLSEQIFLCRLSWSAIVSVITLTAAKSKLCSSSSPIGKNCVQRAAMPVLKLQAHQTDSSCLYNNWYPQGACLFHTNSSDNSFLLGFKGSTVKLPAGQKPVRFYCKGTLPTPANLICKSDGGYYACIRFESNPITIKLLDVRQHRHASKI